MSHTNTWHMVRVKWDIKCLAMKGKCWENDESHNGDDADDNEEGDSVNSLRCHDLCVCVFYTIQFDCYRNVWEKECVCVCFYVSHSV